MTCEASARYLSPGRFGKSVCQVPVPWQVIFLLMSEEMNRKAGWVVGKKEFWGKVGGQQMSGTCPLAGLDDRDLSLDRG